MSSFRTIIFPVDPGRVRFIFKVSQPNQLFMQIKVAIVDDDEGIRSGLSALIKRAKEFKLLGEFANGETALKEIPALQPDVVIMDINLPGMKGYDCVRQIKSANPAIQFLMLTVYEDSDSLFNSLR